MDFSIGLKDIYWKIWKVLKANSVIFTWEYKNKVTLQSLTMVHTYTHTKWPDKCSSERRKKSLKLNPRALSLSLSISEEKKKTLCKAHPQMMHYGLHIDVEIYVWICAIFLWSYCSPRAPTILNRTSIPMSYMTIFMYKILWLRKKSDVFLITNWKRNMICTWEKDLRERRKKTQPRNLTRPSAKLKQRKKKYCGSHVTQKTHRYIWQVFGWFAKRSA